MNQRGTDDDRPGALRRAAPRRSGCWSRHVRARALAAATAILLLTGSVDASDRLYRPAFSLEELVATRSLGQFVLSPDRSRVVYTSVGRFFGHPLFPAFGEDNNLFVLTLATGERQQVTTGGEPKTYASFSPDSQHLLYESEADLWRVDLRSGLSRRLTTHASRDRSGAWSPDGRSIAFVSSRWGTSDLYLMSAEGERTAIRKLTDDSHAESAPVWASDGGSILFTVARDEHFYSRAIYRVFLDGRQERLTPADDARNNLPSVSPDGTRIAYVSDRSGYLNLWTMRPDGSDHRQLTEVDQDQDYPENDYIQTMGFHWSPSGGQVLYFTNRDGNLELWRVDVSTRRAEVIADRDGSHHPVGWVDDRVVAYAYESYRHPPDLFVQPLGGERRQVTYSGRAAYRTEHFDRLESVTWTSTDGIKVHGYLRLPSHTRSGDQLPGVVMSHTYNVGQFYNQWNPIFSYIVQSGFAMLMVNHRGSNGYGVEFRDRPKGNWGFAQLLDIESGAEFLKAHPAVDRRRVGMVGYSMGGYLSLLALTARPALFQAGVSVFGLGEITGDPQRSSRNYVWHLGGTEAQNPEAYRRASPITYAGQLKAPLLILHSDGDPIEPVSKVYNFAQELERHGKPLDLQIYRNEAHGLRQLEHQLDAYQRVMQFLNRHLGGPRPAEPVPPQKEKR
jgi:dipeptidyl aminopeptidase/acylaminoacyl peptidase